MRSGPHSVVVLLVSLFVSSVVSIPFHSTASGDDDHSSSEYRPEPPHQRAPLEAAYGILHVRVTCQHPISQRYFDQGLAMLHGFDSWGATQCFYSILEKEPDCAMAYWGLTIANFAYPRAAREFRKEAVVRQDGVSPREQRWIAAISACRFGSSESEARQQLINSLQKLSKDDPDDAEMKGLCVRELMLDGFGEPNSREGRLIQTWIADLKAHNQHHPIATSETILWSAEDPERAHANAAKATTIAPDNPHLWTLAGRLSMQDGNYLQAAKQFYSASNLFHQQMKRNRLVPDDLEGYADTQDLLVRSLANSGQVENALEVARAMAQSPCSRSSSVDRFMAPAPRSHRVLGTRRLATLLADFELWNELETFGPSARFLGPAGELDLYKSLVRSGMALDKGIAVEDRIDQLRRTYSRTVYDAFVIQRSGHSHGRGSQEEDKATATLQRRSLRGQQDLREILLHQAMKNGNRDRLRESLNNAAPPKTVWSAPLYWAAHAEDDALYAAEFAWQYDPHCALVLARCAEFYLQADDVEKASTMVKYLKQRTRLLNQDLPICHRLAAAEQLDAAFSDESLKLTSGGSANRSPDSGDVSSVPPVWRPRMAPPLSLPDRHGRTHSLRDYRGKPVLLVFFLGADCPHCIEQFQLLLPAKRYMDELDIEIIAVSTDTVTGVREMFEVEGADEAMPFTVVCDDSLEAFRRYGLINEFAEDPLHGTFLIDADGRLRWQHTSVEPFMDFDFFWREARAQLSLNVSPLASETAVQTSAR